MTAGETRGDGALFTNVNLQKSLERMQAAGWKDVHYVEENGVGKLVLRTAFALLDGQLEVFKDAAKNA